MANTIRLKRGTTEPLAANLVTGELAINTGDATVYTKLDDGTVTPIVGKSNNLFVAVRNESGSTIPAFSAVYINGASSNKPTIALAQANSESTSSKTLGFTTAAIDHNHNGEVVVNGLLTKVDTQAYSAGASLWLSPTTPGGATTTMPTAPNHSVFLGTVITSASNGKVEVKVQNGYELQELHNVSIGSVADKDILAYELSSTLWKNKSAATLGIAELSGATFTGAVNLPSRTAGGIAYLNLGTVANNLTAPSPLVEGDIYFTDSDSSGGYNTRLNYNGKAYGGTVTQYSLAVLQNTNFFTQPQTISCSTTAAQSALRVTNTGSGQSLVIEDETNPDTNSFFINADGRVGIGLNPATTTLTVPLQVNGSIIGTTESTSDNSTKVATTAYVKNNLANYTATASLNNTAIATSVNLEYADITPSTTTAPLANSVTRIQNIGASSHTITLPDNATEAIPIGSQFVFINEDGVTTTFQAGGLATVNSRGSLFTMNGQYSVVTAIKVAADTWVIAGDLS